MNPISLEDFKKDGIGLLGELKKSADTLHDKILSDKVIDVIGKANNLLDLKPEDAFALYSEARDTVEKAQISNNAESLASKLVKIEIAQMVTLVLLVYFSYKWPDFGLWKGLVNYHTQSVWAGALGGVTVALWGLYKHIQDRDFDPNYRLWYLLKPTMGGIFGWVVFLIYYVGFLSVQGMDIADIKRPEMFMLLAFLAGFSERFTIKLIDRLMQTLITWDEKPSGAGERKK